MTNDDTLLDGEPKGPPSTPAAGSWRPATTDDHQGSPGVQINESEIDEPGDPDSPTAENDVT